MRTLCPHSRIRQILLPPHHHRADTVSAPRAEEKRKIGIKNLKHFIGGDIVSPPIRLKKRVMVNYLKEILGGLKRKFGGFFYHQVISQSAKNKKKNLTVRKSPAYQILFYAE